MGDRGGSATAVRRSPDRTVAPGGLVAVLDGPAPSAADLACRWSERLAALPLFRQRPPGWGALSARPTRPQNAEVDLDRHLRRVHLTAPGGDEQFEALVGRIMSQRLRAGRPPWEAWTVEGLADGRWALVVKADHSLLDRGETMAPLLAVLDRADAGRPATVGTPGWRRLVGGAATGSQRVVARSTVVAEDVMRFAVGLRPAPSGSSAPSGPLATRRFRVTALELDDVEVVRGAWGCERDDVVRAVVTRAWHHIELAHGSTSVVAGPPAVIGVRGLTAAQRLLGRDLVALVPYAPAVDGTSMTVAFIQYQGRLHLGITCGSLAVADADAFVRALGAALHRFRRLALADSSRPAPAPTGA